MASRIEYSFKNLVSKVGVSLVITLLGFFTRKVFVDSVGVEYLGLNGLLKNILGIMTLLEGGFASSVIYNLYKPLAEDDKPKIIALIQLYRKVYRWIALGIVFFALCLYPFIGFFLKGGDDLEYVGVVYFIFLFNSVIGYFSAYKWSLINASQKGYELTTINLVYQISVAITKLVILYYTKNYILFLVVEAIFNLGYNVAVVKKANSLFPFTKTNEKYVVDGKTKKNIVTNIKALFIHKLGGYFMHSTDNIIISSFVGIASVGFYSNYTLILGLVKSFTDLPLDSYSESIGNLIASESSDKVYSVFKTCFFLNFLLVSVATIVLFNTLPLLIAWWLGPEYIMANITVIIFLLNFYINGIRSIAMTFKNKAGIFIQDRWTPFLQGVLNVVLSLLFVKRWDITGVLLATSISILSIGFWQFPSLCYRYIFHRPLWDYFKIFFYYTFVALLSLLLSWLICSRINFEGRFLLLLLYALITLLIVLLVYWLFFGKSSEFKQIKNYALILLKSKFSVVK